MFNKNKKDRKKYRMRRFDIPTAGRRVFSHQSARKDSKGADFSGKNEKMSATALEERTRKSKIFVNWHFQNGCRNETIDKKIRGELFVFRMSSRCDENVVARESYPPLLEGRPLFLTGRLFCSPVAGKHEAR
jgi:hypothetical protein